jgi:predicted O-methyltransferase YrrM
MKKRNPSKELSITFRGDNVNQTQWNAVDDYLARLLLASDPVSEATLQDSDAAGLPPANVAPNQGKLLQLLAQIHAAGKILEIGTLSGYSTIWLARALLKDGRLITLEANPVHADVARKNIVRANLSHLVEIRVGRAVETLAHLEQDNAAPFDFIFIDADKPSNSEYFTWSLKLSRPGTVIVVDNVVRDGAVVDEGSTDPTCSACSVSSTSSPKSHVSVRRLCKPSGVKAMTGLSSRL